MGDSFVHLHVHTEFSMLDGAAKIKPLLAEAQRLGMPAVAVTDHGNMHAAFEFHRQATAAGVKPIIGIEAYLAPASRYHKKPVFWGRASQRGTDEFGEGGDVSGAGAYTHMTLLAEDATGLRNLFKLSSLASFEGYYRKPRMDQELLAAHSRGVTATTGCPSGEVQTRLRLGQFDEALAAASAYRDIFGAGNLFLELMDHGLPIERSVREGLLAIGKQLGLPPVATNDVHYVAQGDAAAHDALLCVQTRSQSDDERRFRFDGDGYYLKPAEEMRACWDAEVPCACDNTLLIADRVGSYGEVFTSRDRMPRFPVPAGESEGSYLTGQVGEGLAARFPSGVPSGYSQRAAYELGVINGKGFPGYFLVVADVVRWARGVGIRVGPGRGSAAGCLVAWALGITALDPIEHGLLFERFLNPERPSWPDIDVDFDDRRRGEVLGYAASRWGRDRVAQIATFGVIKTRAALKDAGRVLYGQRGFGVAERVSQALPAPVFAKDVPLSGVFDPDHPRYGEASGVRALVESDAEAARMVETARGLEGLVRNVGVHACAVILSREPLVDVVPLWQRDDGAVITGWDMDACEAIGLLKMDFLGLRNLTVLDDALRGIEANGGPVIDLDALALDDQATFELLARGDTPGVFQLDGAGTRELLQAVAPTCFGDISAVLALYRPGPMGANAHRDYADRKNKRQPVRPIHPELAEPLADILGETYGLIVYQEQVMAIAQRVAGYSLASADLLRRAMGKKKKDVLDAEYTRFTQGMRSNGFSEGAAKALWDILVPFTDYAFGRAHAAAYAMLSYWTGYLLAHYPREYLAAVLTSVSGDQTRLAVYLGECRRRGLKVLPPDINDSGVVFRAVPDGVRFGLSAIRNIGSGAAEAIVATRGAEGRFGSFADFLDRVPSGCCNKRLVESLIKAGVFDSLGHTRQGLLGVHESAVSAAAGVKQSAAVGQLDLFADHGGSVTTQFVPEGVEWPPEVLLRHERDVLGLYVSSHPLAGVEPVSRRWALRSIAALLDDAPEGSVTVAGVVAGVEQRVNKRGEPWAVVTVEDLDASIEVAFFARDWPKVQEVLAVGAVIAVSGRVSRRDDHLSLVGVSATVIDVDEVPPLVLVAEATQVDAGCVGALRTALEGHRGSVPVRMVLRYQGRETLLGLEHFVTVGEPLLRALGGVPGVHVASDPPFRASALVA